MGGWGTENRKNRSCLENLEMHTPATKSLELRVRWFGSMGFRFRNVRFSGEISHKFAFQLTICVSLFISRSFFNYINNKNKTSEVISTNIDAQNPFGC